MTIAEPDDHYPRPCAATRRERESENTAGPNAAPTTFCHEAPISPAEEPPPWRRGALVPVITSPRMGSRRICVES